MTITGESTEAKKSISVVIASGACGDFLDRCLESLLQQNEYGEAEILVVDRCGEETAKHIRRKFPFVNVIQTDPKNRLSIPELRLVGAKCAHGDIVAIIEEHCTALPGWIETIRSSFQKDDAAIGGPILDDNYARLSDWVVYFSEYHNYMPPWQNQDRYLLNGANIAYDRKKLLKYEQVLSTGYWEVVLHPLLSRDGNFRAIAQMGVHHTGPFNYGYYLRQRYLLSRVWGSMQRVKSGFMKRLVYLVAAPILPFLLLGRITSKVTQTGRLTRKFIAALPLLVPVSLSYVWGEWLGYLVGVGNALEEVE